jgi:hypothetical protein
MKFSFKLLWPRLMSPPPVSEHVFTWHYYSIADRAVLDCSCGFRRVFSDYDTDKWSLEKYREEVEIVKQAHLADVGKSGGT